MKDLNLEIPDLKELSKHEASTTNGGLFWLPIAVTAAIIISAVDNFGDIRQGLVDGWNGTPRYVN
jgi:hypothetical protein